MSLTKPQIIFLGVVLLIVILVVVGIVLRSSSTSTDNPATIQTTLNVWTLNDNANNYSAAISSFNRIYKGVDVKIKTFTNYDAYKNTIINAMAEGNGPDIFMIPNDSLQQNINFISPVPPTLYTINDLSNQFPNVVYQDFVYNNQIYALPVYIDTLALLYNKNIFNQKGVALPPQTWNDFQNTIQQIITKDPDSNQIILPAAAIGGSSNSINYATDIFLNILMQNKLLSPNTDIIKQSLSFYTQFTNAANNYYTWNDFIGKDFQMFGQEKLAMIFAYAKDLPTIQQQYPLINIATTNFPQFDSNNKISLAKYYGYVVSKQSTKKSIAWQFVLQLTTQPKNANSYISARKLPPALNYLINQTANIPNIGIFAKQNLYAKSFPINNQAITSLSDIIAKIISGQLDIDKAVNLVKNILNLNN
ncbi:MAG: ABC transporter substrate-binding protein [Minisyncoccia bacterium]